MGNKEIGQTDYKNFTIFCLFWVILGWLGFIMALTGYFRPWVIIIYLIAAGALLLKYILRKKIFSKVSRELKAVAAFVAAIIIILSFFTTPTIFSGRDQGSISEAAIHLTQNHKLEFSTPASKEFFNVYGPGKALNFPGFYYTKAGSLITQFPLPYISWLAIFYSLFGLSGLVIANTVLMYIFAVSFYLTGRLFMKILPSTVLLLLAITSFPIFWFLKFTLSENIALALIWFGILQYLLFLKEKNAFYFFSAVAAFGLMMFSRIEGLAIMLALIITTLAKKDVRDYLVSEKIKRIYFPLMLLAAVFVVNFLIDFNFFREIGKTLLNFSTESKSNFQEAFLPSGIYSIKVFLIYGFLQYIILGIAGILYLLKKREYLELTAFFLILPLFIYLLDAHISLDHPWMLRRYAFAILPALIFYTVLFLNMWLIKAKKIAFLLFTVALILLNIPLFFRYAFFSENKNVLFQTKKMSENFAAGDFILVDRLASGDGWSMISGPMSFLYGKQAVYFFNPDDLEKIDKSKFNKIYLITPDKNINFYQNSNLAGRMKYYKNYSIQTTRLDITEESIKQIILPSKINVEEKGKIFEITKN